MTGTEFEYDAPVQRPEPDREIVARAFNNRLRAETPIQKYIRQQWEGAVAATRVAMDLWRAVWPIETADHLLDDEYRALAQEINHDLEAAYHGLDKLSEVMLGAALYEANRGAPEERVLALLEASGPDELETE